MGLMNRRLLLAGISASTLAACAAASVFTRKGIGTKGAGGGSAPVNTVAPAITGTTQDGQVGTCSTGTWTGTPTITFTYQWKRNGSTNLGTSSTYTYVTADVSQNITCVVTATNGIGSASATSNTVVPIANSIPFASAPSAFWDGTYNSGYNGSTPTPTPTPSSFTQRPTARFISVPFQAFCADLTLYVMARAPSGIASVSVYTENGTPVAAANGLWTITDASGLTRVRDTWAVTLKASDWNASGTKTAFGKTGLAAYAVITDNNGNTRTIGPHYQRPMPVGTFRSLPNDFVALVTSNGKDNSGTTVTAPSPGGVYATMTLAEAAIVAGSYSSPMIMIVKDGTYAPGATRGNGSGASGATYAWWPLCCDSGVTAVISAAAVTDFTLDGTGSEYINALWYISRKMPEFRGPGLTIDHKWIQYAQTDSVPAWWDNGVIHTILNVTAVTDPNTGISSVAYNTYFNGGPNPSGGAPHNAVDYDPGIYATNAVNNYVNCGYATKASPLVDKCRFIETLGDPAVNNTAWLFNYTSGTVTQFYDPGIIPTGSIHITYTGANGTATIQKLGLNGAFDSNLTLIDSGTHVVNLFPTGNTAAKTVAQIKAEVEAFTGWSMIVDSVATTSGLAGRYIAGLGHENDMPSPVNAKSVTVDFNLIVAVHTEYYHFSGGDWTDGGGVPHQDNILIISNVLQPNAWWGTANWFVENYADNSWIANNLMEVSHTSGDNVALVRGLNLTYVHNYNSDAENWDVAFNPTSPGGTYANNITPGLGSLGGAVTGMTNTVATGNLTGTTSLVPKSATNVSLTPTNVSQLFVGSGNYLPGGSSVIPSHLYTPLEKYDLFNNVRVVGGDYAGPISSVQTTWPGF